MTAAVSETAEAVLRKDREHVFHSWSSLDDVVPMAVAGAEGCWFWDYEGNKFLDFSSQLVNANLGHQHPRLVQAIQDQAQRLCTIAPGFANDVRSELARRLAQLAPADLDLVFFTNGGADANENAIRLARLHTGRLKILAAYRSYHGATAGAVALTGDPRRWANEPSIPGVVHFFGPHLYRSPWAAATEAEETERALAHLAEVVTLEGPHTVAAIVLEPIVGTNGVLVPPEGYLAGVRRLCDEHGILLIADEVMTGFGRTGRWFAMDHWQVSPDMITFAKGVNSGYVPLGGVIISRRVAETFRQRTFPGGLTYSGHPLACASALASLDVLVEDSIVDAVSAIAHDTLEPLLHDLASAHPAVGDVRGRGFMWALELVRDRESKEPLVPFNPARAENAPMTEVVDACRRSGLWPFTHHNRIHIVPPLICDRSLIHRGVEILDTALSEADKYMRGA